MLPLLMHAVLTSSLIYRRACDRWESGLRGERVSGGMDNGWMGGRAVKSPGHQAPAGQTTRSLMSFCAFILATPPPPPGRPPLHECVLFVCMYTHVYIWRTVDLGRRRWRGGKFFPTRFRLLINGKTRGMCMCWCARRGGEANGDSEICPGPET